jgi:hypothetical protein
MIDETQERRHVDIASVSSIPDKTQIRARVIATVGVLGFALALLAGYAEWPEVLGFALPASGATARRALQLPVLLSDDVMISLRAGETLLKTGVPSLNVTDVAQPSTSVLAPYLAAALLEILPVTLVPVVYMFIGLGAVLTTLAMIVWRSRSLTNGVILATSLSLTSTFLLSLNGWDHLLQGMVLVAATMLAFTGTERAGSMVAVGALLATGCLSRPDGYLIAVSVFVVIAISAHNRRRSLVYSALPFGGIILAFLGLNIKQFGQLLPTTARLKVGAAPSLEYVGRYLFDNGILSFSALTLWVLLCVFVIVYSKSLPRPALYAVFVGSALTGLFAAYNSDAFAAARMWWVPAAVLAAGLSSVAPGFLQFGVAVNVMDPFRGRTRGGPGPLGRATVARVHMGRAAFRFAVALAAISLLATPIRSQARNSYVSVNDVAVSRTAESYAIAEWMQTHLHPSRGSIGLFYLGASYNLPDFEIADFLGKGDELIATTDVKWGPPGHNKWDIGKTLDKWHPQAIITASRADPTSNAAKLDAQKAIEMRTDFGFQSALTLNQAIRSNYRWCFVASSLDSGRGELGLLLRNDIVGETEGVLHCSLWA